MAHLKKTPSGHLRKTGSGHLVIGCDDCCDPCETVEFVFSGVNAAKCGCWTVGSSSGQVFALLVDGTHSVNTLEQPGSICRYGNNIDISGLFESRSYATSTVCGGSFSSSTTDLGNIQAEYRHDLGQFDSVTCTIFGNSFFSYDRVTDGGTYDYGDAIPNANTCSSTAMDPYSDGGTLTVNII